jgi:hypothetical protein
MRISLGKFDSECLTVRVVGGLGNQLFQYYAGQYYALKFDKKLVIDTSHVGEKRTNHGVSIEDFSLPGLFVDRRKTFGEFRHFLERASLRVNEKTNAIAFPSSQKVGLDLSLDVRKESTHLSGYFQSYYYAGEVLKKVPDLLPEIIKPSSWLKDSVVEAAETSPVMIHVRRGDYLTKVDSFGLLDRGYYLQALEKVRGSGVESPIWVISDDIEAAKALLGRNLPGNTTWVSPPSGTRASESLELMRHGGANVIANSTFSWFGAYLSKSARVVVRPEKWFYQMPDPENLGAPSWLTIPSEWVPQSA